MGPVDLTMDLGTTDDRYVRFLGITQAFTGGLPDATWSVISANGYDYSQPAPLVQPVPEPGSGVTILAAWMTLLAARHHSRRDTGVATRAERSAEVSRRLN